MSELKSCPYCGGKPKLHKHKHKYYYECNGDCWTRTKDFWSVSEALEAWNRIVSDAQEQIADSFYVGQKEESYEID